MAIRFGKALRFYSQSFLIGLSALVLALVGTGRKSDHSQSDHALLPLIPTASADIPGGGGSDNGDEGGDGGDGGGDCDEGGDCG